MSEEGNGWTYTADDKVYLVNKFTDEGQVAFKLIVETNTELDAARKKTMQLEMAVRGFNAVISGQLTDDMINEEVENTPEE